jgi:hypothetical protein
MGVIMYSDDDCSKRERYLLEMKKSDVDRIARWGFWVTVTLWVVLVLFVLFY